MSNRPKPTLARLAQVRAEFFRPTAVACLIHQGRVLLAHDQHHRLWLLPQGGIETGETFGAALRREVAEELGQNWAQALSPAQPQFLGEARLEFHPTQHNTRQLTDEEGESLPMKGKHYFFGVIGVQCSDLDLSQAEFDQVIWADYRQARRIMGRIRFKNKKVVLEEVINLLKAAALIE